MGLVDQSAISRLGSLQLTQLNEVIQCSNRMMLYGNCCLLFMTLLALIIVSLSPLMAKFQNAHLLGIAILAIDGARNF